MNGLGFVVLEVAVVALVLALLNLRDRRRARAIAAVFCACPAALRGSIALHARASLLSRRVVLVLDMSTCDHGDVWSVVRRLAEARPPAVTLVVATRLGPALPVAVSVPARGGGYLTTFMAWACGGSGSR
jgi:hypothetical protein